MGKSLIIKGADFSANCIPSSPTPPTELDLVEVLNSCYWDEKTWTRVGDNRENFTSANTTTRISNTQDAVVNTACRYAMTSKEDYSFSVAVFRNDELITPFLWTKSIILDLIAGDVLLMNIRKGDNEIITRATAWSEAIEIAEYIGESYTIKFADFLDSLTWRLGVYPNNIIGTNMNASNTRTASVYANLPQEFIGKNVTIDTKKDYKLVPLVGVSGSASQFSFAWVDSVVFNADTSSDIAIQIRRTDNGVLSSPLNWRDTLLISVV